MRWQDMKNKEIINITTGERLGIFGDCDIEFDINDGRIKSILIPESKGYFSFASDKKMYSLPWGKIKKIGPDMILIEE
ncbi:YlmC/YmxH family sporulation protein [Irregularibacter muris]|uniref:YlmC/YmxH family sporulation protein n=1 Tax=Irregularibacter muris TaxID=1796619 RepID=A0AAE3KZ46_9FIRM|nr:YlmC/YmxH family sporulation protein [Irregularibacter muris]MCR1898096.1 YlmC/YmxH family sporulation protein [Irregularibacter muris]